MKLRAKGAWKPTGIITQHYIQYDRFDNPGYWQFDGINYRLHRDTVTETIGPFNDCTVERKVNILMNRLDVVLESIYVIERRIDGEPKRRTTWPALCVA